ncbi:MAG: D-alanine--D-alanine ligase [Solirubrobacteraceae bacterium]
MTAGKRVAVLKGGHSLERAVSLRSGAQVQDGLQRLGHEVVAIDAGAELVPQLLEADADAAFIALHGPNGEDGIVQGLLEAIGLPYTGSGPAACMRCTDKLLAKYLMREAGIPTPAFHALREASIKELGAAAALASVERALGFPLVVKPAKGGSALGVKFARTSDELPGAMVGAFSYDSTIVLERYVEGRDLAVSVLDAPGGAPDGASGGAPAPDGVAARASALPVVEAVPRDEGFYDYESRYEIGMTTFVCPADLPKETTERAQELALSVYELLGCHGVARIDLMLEQNSGELWVLETNVVPGMTATSLLPQAADAAGIGFEELVERILSSAFTR